MDENYDEFGFYHNRTMRFPTMQEIMNALLKIESKPLYNKNNCDMKLLKDEQNLLKRQILMNTKQNFFNVYDIECSGGKTYCSIESLIYYLYDIKIGKLPNRGVIFVVQRENDCDLYTNEINEILNGNYALSVTSSKYDSNNVREKNIKKNKLFKQIQYFPIIFITHERYKLLAIDENERNLFIKNRGLLIIDEYLNMCKKIKITEKYLENIAKALTEQKQLILFYEITKIIDDKFKEYEEIGDNLMVEYFNDCNAITKINELINSLSKKNHTLVENFNNGKIKLIDSINQLKFFFNNVVIIKRTHKKGAVSFNTYDNEIIMWTLDNNIILDASACFNHYYLNRDLFFVMNNKPILDHKNWELYHINISSTKQAKKDELIVNFDEASSKIIKMLGEEQTLNVCNKSYHIDENDMEFNPYCFYNCELENISHFHNITGDRKFSELKNIFINHTPQMEELDYVLEYLYYSKSRYKKGYVFDIKLTERRVFELKKLQLYKDKQITNEIYQAVKRVNREMKYNSKIVILIKNKEVIYLLKERLQNCQTKDSSYFSDFFITMQEIKRKEKNTYLSRTLDLFKAILDNYIQDIPEDIKSLVKFENNNNIIYAEDIMVYIGMNNKNPRSKSANFSNKVLKKNEFDVFKKNYNIAEEKDTSRNNKKYFVIPSKKEKIRLTILLN